jgi:hypothetical protein
LLIRVKSQKQRTRQVKLLARGLSLEQARFYIASREVVVQKRNRVRYWNKSVPPTLRQSFGLLGKPLRGIRIPLLPFGAVSPRLAALRPTPDWPSVELWWMQQFDPHVRGLRFDSHEEGHRYYVDSTLMESAVTGC